MHFFCVSVFIISALACATFGAPVANTDSPKEAKSAFGAAFDEIVVESSLTVKKKSGTRQSRDNDAGVNASVTDAKKVKRQTFPNNFGRKRGQNRPTGFGGFGGFSGGGGAADAQSQAFNAHGPLGNFGASAAGTQTQGFGFGPGGAAGGGGFSGSQAYHLPNGQTVDVSFANTFSGANSNPAGPGVQVSLTGADGQKTELD